MARNCPESGYGGPPSSYNRGGAYYGGSSRDHAGGGYGGGASRGYSDYAGAHRDRYDNSSDYGNRRDRGNGRDDGDRYDHGRYDGRDHGGAGKRSREQYDDDSHDRRRGNDRGGGAWKEAGRSGDGDRDEPRRFMRQERKLPFEERQVDPVELSLKTLLMRIGEKSQSTLERNIEMLAAAVEGDVAKHKDFFITTLFLAVETMPGKIPIYGALIGVLNLKNPAFVAEFVKALQDRLENAIVRGQHDILRYLVRLTGELVNGKVVTASDFLALCHTLLGFVNSDDTASSALDSVLYTVLTALPYAGPELLSSAAEGLADLLSTLDARVSNRGSRPLHADRLKALQFFDVTSGATELSGDLITQWLDAVKAQVADGTFETLSSILRPSRKLEDLQASSAATIPITVAHVTDLAAMKLGTQTMRHDSGLLAGSHEQPSVFAPLQNEHGLLDRLLVKDQLHDLIDCFADIHKQGMQYILSLPIEWEYHFLIVEVFFSRLFELPTPRHSLVYYATLMMELFRQAAAKFGPLMGRAINFIFQNIRYLDVECRDRFCDWFSLHLSNFNYQWAWPAWVNVADASDDDERKVWLRQLLLKLVRLTYWDKVIEVTPEPLHSLMPPKPDPVYPFGDGVSSMVTDSGDDAVSAKRGELAGQLLEQIKTRSSAGSVLQWLNSTVAPALSSDARSELLVPVLLHLGSTSYSHLLVLIERYKVVLDAVMSSPEAQSAAVDAAAQYWRHSPQHVSFILGRFLLLKLVDASVLLHWALADKHIDMLCTQSWPWDIVHGALSTTLKRAQVTLQESKTRSDAAMDIDEPVAPHLTQEVLRLTERVFVTFFTRVASLTDSASPAQQVPLGARLRQYMREFSKDLQPMRSMLGAAASSSSSMQALKQALAVL